ncbi:MAG: 30S ribosomal protein S9 [Bacteroidales bacterium]|nr:30S ribosomal protein S9 [Bacteroidales bacterium]MCF8337974.1 30S ribosomal protein S9 [Bacteroidales bacterium]
MEVVNAVGRRKTAIARVYLKPGSGDMKVNDRGFDEFFPSESTRKDIVTPFNITETNGKYDVLVRITGGGKFGQAEATRLGIARALNKVDEEFHLPLKENGLLRRDARMVERKKPGRKKARKKFQFSKR